jgi:hypothetical protein
LRGLQADALRIGIVVITAEREIDAELVRRKGRACAL